MRKFISQLWKDDRGQSTTEYILILSVVVMIAMRFKSLFGTQLEKILTNVSGKIDQATSSDQ